MDIVAENIPGKAELFCPLPTTDEMRAVFEKKSRVLIDKTMTVKEAVSRFVADGDYVAAGGFGHVRTPMAVLYEIIRQKKRNLGFAGHPGVHDVEVLCASGCLDRIEVAYCFGHELRSMKSMVTQRIIRSGKVKTNEWSNASFSWRYKAAGLGLTYMPAKFLLGTETLTQSGAKITTCPFTGETYTALPALYPDVAIIHVHRADKYGNCQIDGIRVADYDLARAAKKLIISAEEIIDTKVIREKPYQTVIPFYLVDAVCEVPWGSHPCEMPYMYWFDEDHMTEYLTAAQNEETLETYFNKYVYGVENFEEYLELCGGINKLGKMGRIEDLRELPS